MYCVCDVCQNLFLTIILYIIQIRLHLCVCLLNLVISALGLSLIWHVDDIKCWRFTLLLWASSFSPSPYMAYLGSKNSSKEALVNSSYKVCFCLTFIVYNCHALLCFCSNIFDRLSHYQEFGVVSVVLLPHWQFLLVTFCYQHFFKSARIRMDPKWRHV